MQYNKLTLLDEIAESTRSIIAEVNETYVGQPARLLQRPAENGGWSVVQCLEHLNTYSAYYLPYMEQAILLGIKSETPDYGSSWLGNYFIQLMKADGKKYKAARRHQPEAALKADEVLGKFIVHQYRFLQLIERAKTADLHNGRIPVSIFPVLKLNLGDVFQFMAAHQQRHLWQARSVL